MASSQDNGPSGVDTNGLIFFNRLEDEKIDEAEPATGSGVFSSIISRFRKNDDSNPPSTSGSSRNLENISVDTATAEAATDIPRENGTVELPGKAHLIRKTSQNSPSTTSIGSQEDNSRRSRISSIFRGGSKEGLVDYNRSNFKQYWMPDSTGKECYQCEERFTAFRLCGQIFCAKCCNIHMPGATLGYAGDLRLCHYCAKMMDQCLPPESSRKKSTEDFPTANGGTPLEETSTEQNGDGRQNDAMISTVSAGNLMWARNGENGPSPRTERKDSLTLPPPTYKPPTMLCVQELYNQHENNYGKPRAPSMTSTLCDEEESGPDWFRNMASSHSSFVSRDSSFINREDSKTQVRLSTDDFEPQPISLDDSLNLEEVDGMDIRATARKTPSPEELPSISEDDVNQLFDRKTERMVDYLFRRERIHDERWKNIILSLAKKIATTVTVDVEGNKDLMNVLAYVHIKKVFSDTDIPRAETIWGVVCTKTVLHSSMSHEQQNASVMIIGGSIEYERIQGKLSSIDPILSQEAEFLSKQVDRIMTRRPSLLLVEGCVSRIAANLLRKAGVAVVVQVKENVLRRIARSTGADIMPSSDAQLLQKDVGFCPSFSQHVETLKNGREKIFLVFDECPPERGCSVILRGSDERELHAVKRVLQLMITMVYSANCEKAFLNLFNLRLAYQISNCEICEIRRTAIEHNEEKSEFEEELGKNVLGISPFVEFEPPFLETPKGRKCTLVGYFKHPLYRFGTDEEFETIEAMEREEINEKANASALRPPPLKPYHQFATGKDTDEEKVSSFRAMGDLLFRKRIAKIQKPVTVVRKQRKLDRTRRNDVLCPFIHQRIAVLFGSFSPKSPNSPYFCVRPWVLSMDFYEDHDMCLGEFLTKYCFNRSYACPSTNCEVPMLDHSRKLVFGRVCVEVITQIVVQNAQGDEQGPGLSSYIANGNIITWHYCPTCKCSSPVVPFTPLVWNLSFGKYLDYVANAAFTKGCVSSPSHHHQCSHCFFHQQTHFFAQNNFVTTVKVTPIRPFDVVFSPVVCNIQPHLYNKKDLLDTHIRLTALADDTIGITEERLLAFIQHEQFNQCAGTFHTVLRQLVDKTKALVDEKRQYSEQLRKTDKQKIPSNDIFAIKANETTMYIREAIYNLITTWNDQSGVLGATIRALRKADEGTQEGPEISLEKIDDPFPSYLHLGLKLHPRVGVIVRDIQDIRGNYKPDIGSIIGYALSAIDYEEGRRKARFGGEVPLNLNSDSIPTDETALSAEHLELEFHDQSAHYYVKAYFAERFRLLRKLLFAEGEEAFVRSLSQSVLWTPQGGKSGSFFYKTQDDRFIMKQMGSFEIKSFLSFAPNYFEYIKTAVTENKLTTLCKVYGVFRVGVKSKTTQLKVDILVMEYLFYKHSVNQVWDLKGSLRNRLASVGNNPEDVLLDENLVKDLWNNQLYVFPHAKAALNQAISNDSHFLSSQKIMDYSLLCGVDENSGQLLLGIVDYMRTYTFDKKMESWVKIMVVPGAHLPTILSPEMYCTRFSEAIDTYFPVVPDQWVSSSISY